MGTLKSKSKIEKKMQEGGGPLSSSPPPPHPPTESLARRYNKVVWRTLLLSNLVLGGLSLFLSFCEMCVFSYIWCRYRYMRESELPCLGFATQTGLVNLGILVWNLLGFCAFLLVRWCTAWDITCLMKCLRHWVKACFFYWWRGPVVVVKCNIMSNGF